MLRSPLSSPLRSPLQSPLAARRGGVAYNPVAVFGADLVTWYGNSVDDLWRAQAAGGAVTLYQDHLGTTPVTALEQTVGRINDLSGNGYHLTQSTPENRGRLSARYNLLADTEPTTTLPSGWQDFSGGGVRELVILPSGQTGIRYTANNNRPRISFTITGWSPGETLRARVYISDVSIPTSTRKLFEIRCNGAQSNSVRVADYSGPGFYEVSHTIPSGTTGVTFVVGPGIDSNVTEETMIAGIPDVRPNSLPASWPQYQRVGANDYDTFGFPVGLMFSGGSRSYQSGVIDLSVVSSASCLSSIFMSGRQQRAVAVEFTESVEANAGGFAVFAPSEAGNGFAVALSGAAGVTSFSRVSSEMAVLYSSVDLAEASRDQQIEVRVNGANDGLVPGGLSSAGGGSLASSVVYVGSRNGASLPFKGVFFSLPMLVNRRLTQAEILQAEFEFQKVFFLMGPTSPWIDAAYWDDSTIFE